MNDVLAVCLVLVLATSSYAAGRLHAQLGYRLGFRSGYRQGFGDGDRAARHYQRGEVVTRSAPMVADVPTVASPDLTVASAPAAAEPSTGTADATVAGTSSGSPAAVAMLTRPAVPPALRLGAPEGSPANRAAVMRGTMYHSTGAIAGRGRRHAHPE